jgi:predicted DNA-binding transcriptional regulator YafY
VARATPRANSFSSAQSIFRILAWAEADQPISTSRVRKDLGVSDRQARDYLAFLVGLGRLRALRRGRVDEYYLNRPQSTGKASLTQAIGAELAVAALRALRGTAFHEGAEELVSSIRNSLPEVQGPRAVRLRSAFFTVRGSVPKNLEHAAHAETILEALMHGNSLRGRYERLSDGEISTYVLRPISLVVHHEGLHLLARKRDGKVRLFDVEGFRELERTRRTTSPSGSDLTARYEHAFGRYTDFPPRTVRLRLRGVAARQVRRRDFHASQRRVRDSSSELDVEFTVGLCPEFKAWILGMVPDVEVLSPREFRDEMRARLEAGVATNAI